MLLGEDPTATDNDGEDNEDEDDTSKVESSPIASQTTTATVPTSSSTVTAPLPRIDTSVASKTNTNTNTKTKKVLPDDWGTVSSGEEGGRKAELIMRKRKTDQIDYIPPGFVEADADSNDYDPQKS